MAPASGHLPPRGRGGAIGILPVGRWLPPRGDGHLTPKRRSLANLSLVAAGFEVLLWEAVKGLDCQARGAGMADDNSDLIVIAPWLIRPRYPPVCHDVVKIARKGGVGQHGRHGVV